MNTRLLDAGNLSEFLSNPSSSIDQKLNTGKARQITENRNKIIPIIKTIFLCGCQNISYICSLFCSYL